MKRLLVLPLAFTLVACGGLDLQEPDLEQNTSGNLEIIVSNQSFEIDAVDVAVRIDGELAVSDIFEVGSQHTFVSHTFRVSPGTHTLTAESDRGEATLTSTIEVTDDKRWAVLMYWYYPEETGGADPTPRQFSYFESDTQPAFD